MEFKDRARVSPWILGGVGAISGALLGRMIAERNARSGVRYEDLDIEVEPMVPASPVGSYSVDTAGTAEFGTSDVSGAYVGSETYGSGSPLGSSAEESQGGGLKEKAREAASSVKERASEVKSKAADVGTNVRAKASDASYSMRARASDVSQSLRDKAGGARQRAQGALSSARSRAGELRQRLPSGSELRSRTSQDPLMIGLGAALLGGLAALLLPVTSRERQVIAPKKQEAIGKVKAKVEEVKEDAKATVEGFKQGLGADSSQPQSQQWSGQQSSGSEAGWSSQGSTGSSGNSGWSASDQQGEGGSATTGASFGSTRSGESEQSERFGAPGELSGGSERRGTVTAGAGYELQSPAANPDIQRSGPSADEDQSKRNPAEEPGGFEDDLKSIH